MAVTEYPTTNKAIVYAEPGTLKTEIRSLDVPEPGNGQILVRM